MSTDHSDQTQFQTGAVRSKDADETRYDLLSPIAIRRYAEAMAEGAEKYGDYNWEKGMPVHDILNHGLRHIFLYLAGDRSEDHLGHAMWNIAAACHSDELWPELNAPHLRTEGCGLPQTMIQKTLDEVGDVPLSVSSVEAALEAIHGEDDNAPSERDFDPDHDEHYRQANEAAIQKAKAPTEQFLWKYRLRTDHHPGWEIYEATSNFIAGYVFEKILAKELVDWLNDDPISSIAHAKSNLVRQTKEMEIPFQLHIIPAKKIDS